MLYERLHFIERPSPDQETQVTMAVVLAENIAHHAKQVLVLRSEPDVVCAEFVVDGQWSASSSVEKGKYLYHESGQIVKSGTGGR